MDCQSFDNVRIRCSITVVKQTGLSIHQISFKNISNGAESVEQFFTNIDWVGKIERKHFYLPNFVVTWYTATPLVLLVSKNRGLLVITGAIGTAAKKFLSVCRHLSPNHIWKIGYIIYHSRWRSLGPVQSREKDGLPRTTRGPSKCY